MTPLRVLVDLDEVGANCLQSWLDIWNREQSQSLTIDDIKQWEMPDPRMYEIIARPGFFANLQPLPGFVEALRWMKGAGIEVILVTASMAPSAVLEKRWWIGKYLPFMETQDIVIALKKHIITADVLIDDSPHNITAYREAHLDATILIPAYPHNASMGLLGIRIEGWQDMGYFWDEAVEWLNKLC